MIWFILGLLIGSATTLGILIQKKRSPWDEQWTQVAIYKMTLGWYAKAGPMDLATDCDFFKEDGFSVMKAGRRARLALKVCELGDE